jgi:hypothetical protein
MRDDGQMRVYEATRATGLLHPPTFRNQFTMRISGSTKTGDGHGKCRCLTPLLRRVILVGEPALRECLDLKRVWLHLICDAAQLLCTI